MNARKIGIVVSTYNDMITNRLLEGAQRTLEEAGKGEHVEVIRVPGAWEIPLAAQHFATRADVAGVVTLGAVIRGETTHDQHINRSVSSALMDLMLQTNKPIGLGLLTCNTLDQAMNRAGGRVGNKGEETAQAVLAMLELSDPPS